MTTPTEALHVALATIERLDPTGSRATQGTRDVINAALTKPSLPLEPITIDIDQIPDGQSRKEIVTIIVRRRGKRIVCALNARVGSDPARGLELTLTAARKNTDVIKRITAAPWLEER